MNKPIAGVGLLEHDRNLTLGAPLLVNLMPAVTQAAAIEVDRLTAEQLI